MTGLDADIADNPIPYILAGIWALYGVVLIIVYIKTKCSERKEDAQRQIHRARTRSSQGKGY